MDVFTIPTHKSSTRGKAAFLIILWAIWPQTSKQWSPGPDPTGLGVPWAVERSVAGLQLSIFENLETTQLLLFHLSLCIQLDSPCHSTHFQHRPKWLNPSGNDLISRRANFRQLQNIKYNVMNISSTESPSGFVNNFNDLYIWRNHVVAVLPCSPTLGLPKVNAIVPCKFQAWQNTKHSQDTINLLVLSPNTGKNIYWSS